MMGKATTNWSRHKHAFLRRVANGPCYAKGSAEGAACTHLRSLFWVRQVDSRIGIKVEITDAGRRALELWEAGERMPLDVRTEEERVRDVVRDLVDKAAAAGVVAQLAKALIAQIPPELGFSRGGFVSGRYQPGGRVLDRSEEVVTMLSPLAQYVSADHPLAKSGPSTGQGHEVVVVQLDGDLCGVRGNLAPSVGTVCRRMQR